MDCKTYKDRYKVFADGTIIGPKNRRLKKRFNKGGYIRAAIYHNGKRSDEFVHKIVAELFICNSENKPQVNHINGIKTDNRVENLEWCTASENTRHAWKSGLMEGGKETIIRKS